MTIGWLGAIKEYPLALVRSTSLQSSKSIRLRQTDHLYQHTAKVIRAGSRSKLDCSRIRHRQYEGKFPAFGGQLARCLLRLRPLFRWIQKKVSQRLSQFQGSPVIAGIDMLSAMQETALTHPHIQHARGLQLVPASVGNAAFDIAAPVVAVDEIVKQRELGRYGVFL